MKAPRLAMVLILFLAAFVGLPEQLHAAAHAPAHHPVLETKFGQAQDTLYALLLPNSMARTQPQSQQDVQRLLTRFERLASFFKKDARVAVPFLTAKVKSTPVDDQDPGLCALQLLYEINTKASRQVIEDAQKGSNEMLSEKAASMIQDRQGLLWGFRH